MDEAFKKPVIDYIEQTLGTIKPEEVQEGYSFCDFEDGEGFSKLVSGFVTKNQDLCIQNIQFFSPNRISFGAGNVHFQRDGDTEIKSLEHFVNETLEDFTNSFLYNNYTNTGWKTDFETSWLDFIDAFNSKECVVEFIAPIYDFWLEYSGSIKDTFDANDVKLRWLDNQSDFHLLNNSNRDTEKNTDVIPRYLLSRKIKVDKSKGLTDEFNKSSDLFKLNTLMLRTLFGGMAHIRFMVVKSVGSLSGYAPNMLYQYYPTYRMQYNRYPTRISHDFEQRRCFEYWEELAHKEYRHWVFTDTKLLEYAAPPQLDSMDKAHSDYMYLVAEQMDKTVNLVQVLENLIGEFGESLGEYTLLVGYDTRVATDQHLQHIKDTIEWFVKLRNKYLHGSVVDYPHTKNSLMKLINSRYAQIEGIVREHELVERAIRQVLSVSFLNSDLKMQCIEDFTITYPKKKLIHDFILANPKGKALPSLTRL